MKKSKSVSGKVRTPREEAEQRLAAKSTAAEQRSDVDARRLIHELQVHQIELEMQNEELRRAQAELEESRSRYSDLYDFAPVGYFTFDQQGLILEVNLTGTTLLGVTRSALAQKPFFLFIAPEHKDAFHLHLRQVMQTGTRQSCEIRLVKKDGSWFHTLLESIAVDDGEQNASRCRTVVTDITERKQIADAQSFLLQCDYKSLDKDFFESLARYLAEKLHMYYVCIDQLHGDGLTAKTMAVYCDGKFEDNVEYTLKDTPCGDVVGKTICTFPKDVCRLFPQDRVLQEMHAESYVGTTLWSSWGQPIGLIAVIGQQQLPNPGLAESMLQLVAARAAGELERRLAEQALRESEEQNRTLANFLESSSQAFGVGYPDGSLGYINAAFERLTGYSRDELRGMSWSQTLTPTEWRASEAAFIAELHRTGNPVRYEKEYIRKDGARVPIELYVHLVKDDQGQPLHYYSFITNLTERKRAEKSLRRNEERLKLLSDTAAQLLASTEPQAIVNELCVKVMGHLDCHTFFNFLADDNAGRLHLNAFAGIPEEEAQKIEWLDYGVAVCGCAAAEGHRIVAEDILCTPDPRTELVKSYGIQAYACHPIMGSGGRIIGTFSFGTRNRTKFTAEELELMRTVADQVAIAMERMQLVRTLQLQRQELQMILDSAPAMIFYKDTENRFIRTNRALEDAMGLSKNELKGKSISDLYPHEQADAYWRDDKEVLASGKAKYGIIEPMETCGKTLLVKTDKIPYVNEQGTVAGIIGFALDITAQKQAEDALRTSEERLRLAMEIGGIGSFDRNLQTNTVVWDAQAQIILDLTEGNPDPAAIRNIIHPDDRAKLLSEMNQSLGATTRILNLSEFRIVRPDGQIRWVAALGRVFYDESADPPRPLRRIGVIQDITERKQAEMTLRESREDLNRAQAVAHTGSWRLNIQRNELLWSEENHRMFGVLEGTPLSYETFLSIVHPEDREYVDRQWRAALRGEPYDIEHRIIVDGSVKWVREQATLEVDGTGTLLGGFGTTQDITGLKLAEEKLQESEERFRTMANAMPQLAWIAWPDGHIYWYNQRWYDYTGTIPEQMEGWGWQSVHDPVVLPEVLEKWRTSLATGQTFEMEFPLRGADGHFRSFLTRGVPLKDASGHVVQWLGTNTDVTERKQAEEVLRRAKDELELRVQERTAELAQTNMSLKREIQERQRVHNIVVRQSRLLESFFGSTITPLMFLDRHFNVIRVNEAYARAFRRDAHEFPGNNYFDLYPQPALRELFKSVAATGEPFEAVAMPFTFPDKPELGTTYWNWTLTPLLDEHDEVESMVFSLEDVTETQKAHQDLEAAVRYTRSLIEASLDPLVTISKDGKIMDANTAAELAVGIPREQIIGSDFSSYFTEPGKARTAYQQAFLNGFVQDYPLEIKHPLGTVMDILYNAAVYRNSRGEIEGVFAAARDITERRRVENALLESEQRLKIAQRIAHLGSWEWNLMSGEQLWSAEMYRIFGYDPQAITMTHEISFNAVHPEDKDYVIQSVWETLESGTSYNIDFRFIRPDGEVHYLNSQAELYMDEQGSPLRMVGSVLEITERKKIERELQESEQQLRFLSAQLLTAQELERKRIAGEVHDELGQAMTVLKLRLRTIEKQLRTDQEKVKGECLDLLGYADSILKSVRRISRDLTPSVLDDLGLSAAVRWLIDNFRQNPDLNIELHTDDIDSLVPKVLQINVYRILQECLNNCVKHAEARNITVSIQNNLDSLLLLVEDDGEGFNPEQLASLDASRKGMGISTMRERALLLNGTLDITSREGAGTIVTLKIPCKKEGEL